MQHVLPTHPPVGYETGWILAWDGVPKHDHCWQSLGACGVFVWDVDCNPVSNDSGIEFSDIYYERSASGSILNWEEMDTPQIAYDWNWYLKAHFTAGAISQCYEDGSPLPPHIDVHQAIRVSYEELPPQMKYRLRTQFGITDSQRVGVRKK